MIRDYVLEYFLDIMYTGITRRDAALPQYPPKSNLTVYIVYIMYIYIYGTPPKTHTFSEFTGMCAILLFFTMFKCLFFLASILYFQKVV